jgi:type IV pilus assembly protein PilA
MLILGILAAIALPAFFNQKEKAGDAKAKEYAHTTQVAMETYSTDNNGSYENATVAALTKIEPTVANIPFSNVDAEGNFEPAPGPTSYTITVEGSNPQQTFTVNNEGGTLSFPCTIGGKGGCPDVGAEGGAGDWGG